MPYQTSSKVRVAIHAEATAYAISTQTGAHILRITDSPGLVLGRANVLSNEKRSDALREMARLGYKTVTGSFNTELSVGGAVDLLHAAMLRATASAAVNIAFASVTTVAIATNDLQCPAGSSFLTAGVRVGDIFTLAGTTVSTNHGKNTRALAVTTNTITVATGVFTTLAASATGTLTILKKITNPTSPVLPTFTIEQLDTDITQSERFIGCVLVGMSISMRPGQMVTIQYTFLGVDRTKDSSAYFTSPVQTTSLQMVADDSAIRFNGAAVAYFNGLTLNFGLTAAGEPVIGSLTTPQVFDNDMGIEGSITSLRSDFAALTLFDAETEFDVSVLLQEPTGSPPAAFSYFLPRVKIGGISAPAGGGDGAKIETRTLLFGPKATATGYDTGNVVIHSSGA